MVAAVMRNQNILPYSLIRDHDIVCARMSGIDQVGADLGHAGNAFHVLYPGTPQKRGVAMR
ncbi:hypothetical protein BCH_02469 [Brucella sp. 191011898]|nr:hypothetical protein BCH_02469 [Brucella sp. 191011898]